MATLSIRCGHCGEIVSANVISAAKNGVSWLQCPNSGCRDGSVKTLSGAVYPVAPAGGTVTHLEVDVAQAWREARTSHAVAAYTASEIMCRKILMHIAVGVAGSAVGKHFVEYVEDLEKGGYVTTGTEAAVKKIKDRGNGANHELPASTEEESLATLRLTEHLLRSVYEIPNL